MRRRWASRSRADIAKQYLNFYAGIYPAIEAAAPPELLDEREENVVTVKESYRIPGFWPDARSRYDAWLVDDHLARPASPRRTTPLDIDHPVNVTHSVDVHLPEHFQVDTVDARVTDPAFEFEYRARSVGNRVTLTWVYRSLADEVPAERMPEYMAKLEQARGHFGFGLTHQGRFRLSQVYRYGLMAGGAVVFLALISAIVGAVQRRRRRRTFARLHEHAPGTTAGSALSVQDDAEVDRTLKQRPCDCGASLHDATPDRSRLRLGDRPLLLVSRVCGSCSVEQSLYFLVEEEG